jgi:hypothetical protein
MGPPCFFKQRDELPEAGLRHMTELSDMTAADRLIERLEQLKTGIGDANLDDPPVFNRSIPADQCTRFQFVQQSRNVGSPRDKSLRQHERLQAVGMLAMQEAQRVVLLRSQVDRLEELVLFDAETVVGSPKMEKSLLLQRIETPAFPRGGP